MEEIQEPAEAGQISPVTIFIKTVPDEKKHLLGTPEDIEVMATLADEVGGIVTIVDLDKKPE